ncbi:MAG: tRNA epoxyqueuosine(34) reductase QueG [Hydrotalea sp.]|nr:tRNA epoxyqueuosine(34) reductase QueG [Hydrotalea sp.]
MTMVRLADIKSMAVDLGFYHVAVAPIKIPNDIVKKYDDYIARGYHGDMAWLANHRAARINPQHIFVETKSILVLTHPYHDQSANHSAPDAPHGLVARYARGVDYHRLLKEKLARVQDWLRAQNIASRAITDSAPFFEKPMAAVAGIGWQGKHSNLLSRDIGNWFFLAELLLSVEVSDDKNGDDAKNNQPVGSCGSCHKCLDACPTAAFPAPYQLDARKCISYLTIEHHGAIDKKFRRQIGDMIFGCDICLAVCPFNKFAASAKNLKKDARLQGPAGLGLGDILTMDGATFTNRFSQSPIKRLGLHRLQRNALIVLANYFYDGAGAGNEMARGRFLPLVLRLLQHDVAVVRGAAVWCLRAIAAADQTDGNIFHSEKEKYLPQEPDPMVAAEWRD